MPFRICAQSADGRTVLIIAGEVYVVEVASEEREQIQRSADTALTAVLAIRQVVIDLDAVLGHDQLINFISALQFLSEQFAVAVGIGDVGSEVIVQLVVGVCPSAVLGMLGAFGYHVVGKLPDVVSHEGSRFGDECGSPCIGRSLAV